MRVEGKNVKISIIMPVHNTGIYLEESLGAIFDQLFESFELICVDDASSDKLTKEILGQYKLQHSNMMLITLKENLGAGEARNIGFSYATGDYVIFLDGDDIFKKEMLSVMYDKAISENADVCVCGYTAFYMENKKKIYAGVAIPMLEKIRDKDAEDWFMHQIYVPWNKLCRREFLIEQKIFFQNISSSNDVFFSCMALKKANRISVLSNVLVEYRTNTSIQISSTRNPRDIFTAIELLEEKLGQENKIIKQLWVMKLRVGWFQLCGCRNENYQKETYERLLLECKKNERVILMDLKANFLRENIARHSFESKWFKESRDFLNQMKWCLEVIKSILVEESQLYLWGLGKRGTAFQLLCKKEGFLLTGVADKNNKMIGQCTEHGYKIVHTEEVLGSSGLIIASNSQIWNDLGNMLDKSRRIINLESYCPWPEDDGTGSWI